MPNGPTNWSVSAGRLYESCAHAFYLKYVEKVKMPKGETPLHWRLGTVCHAGLEAAFKQRKAERGVGPMMTDSTWEAAKAAIAKSWAEEEMPAPEASDGMWDRVHIMVEKTLTDQSMDWEMIVEVEKKLRIQTGMNIVGFVDLLMWVEYGKVIRVRDWKSRSTKSTAEELEDDFQGTLYGGMLYRMYPELELVQFSHYYPPIAEEVVVDITREAGEAAISRLRAIRDMAHHDKKWETNKSGGGCEGCAYKTICPAWQVDEEKTALDSQVGMF